MKYETNLFCFARFLMGLCEALGVVGNCFLNFEEKNSNFFSFFFFKNNNPQMSNLFAPEPSKYFDRKHFDSLGTYTQSPTPFFPSKMPLTFHAESYRSAMLESRTVYVGNLSFYTREEQIHALFSRVGRIVLITMGLDKNTLTPCGFCFVEYLKQQHTTQPQHKHTIPQALHINHTPFPSVAPHAMIVC